jgi:hypothetical protein
MTQKTQKSGDIKWWMTTARLRRPEENEAIQKRMMENQEFLFNAFRERKDATKLFSVLEELINDIHAFAHYWGVLRGFTTAEQIEKLWKKKNERYKIEIGRIIVRHPDWSAKEIFAQLDEREVRFVRLGHLPKTEIRRWSDVADEPSYKVLVSRVRQYVEQLNRVKAFNRIVKEHKQLRGE